MKPNTVETMNAREIQRLR